MNTDDNDSIWVDRYTPTCLNEVILAPNIRNVLDGYIKKGTIPNLMFYGKPGIGKTLIAKLIAKELDASLMFINSSAETGVDVVRNKIIDFANSVAMNNGLKIVLCDEFDYMSSAAQASLRDVIQSNSEDTRFLFTCNYDSKVMEPLQSRCIPLEIFFDIKDVLKRCFEILDKEHIDYSENKKDVAYIVKKNFPDIRRTIGTLELCCVNKKFELLNLNTSDNFQKVAKYIQTNLNNPKECRKYLIANEWFAFS